MSDGKRVIWKYLFAVQDRFTINMPFGSKIRHVEEQHGVPCMWVEVMKQSITTRERRFQVFGTGHERIEGELEYIGSFLSCGGDLVWHLYEEVQEEEV